MRRFSRPSLLLLTLGAFAAAVAQTAPEYITTAQTAPQGTAPGMKVKLLSENGGQKDYAVIFREGDEFVAGLTQFAQEYHIQSAHLTALGALRDAKLGSYDPERKSYRVIPVPEQVEVASLVGDIALLNGKPSLHMHCVVSLPDGSTRGGHVLGGHVEPLLEVWVTADPTPLVKKYDDKTGLNLMDPEAKP
jgi:uncharacterized protein